MDKPSRKNYRIPQYDYSQNGVYFITICTQHRIPLLSKILPCTHVGTPVPGCPGTMYEEGTSVTGVELLPCGQTADKIIQQLNAFYAELSIDKYVIMPDHIHMLITIDKPDGHPGTGVPTKRTSRLAQFVSTFKRFCNKEYGSNIWQSRYYDHVVRNQQDYNEIWEYIEYNPTKWLLTHQKPR